MTIHMWIQISLNNFSAVWKELEKENREFFETYKKDHGSQRTSPSSEQSSTSRSSDDNDN
jgi:hypothetical protein